MAAANIINREAYLRKMALSGYVVRMDLSDIRRLTQILGNISGNINQIAKRVNATDDVLTSDIADIKAKQELIWAQTEGILRSLANIR